MNLCPSLHEALNCEDHLRLPLFVHKSGARTLLDLKEHSCRLISKLNALPYQSYALNLDDTFSFTCALIACLYASKTAVLPGHNVKALLQDELKALRYDCLITEQEEAACSALPILNLKGLDNSESYAADAYFKHPPRQDSPIVMYTSGSTGESKKIVKPLYCMERESVLLQGLFRDRLSDNLTVSGTVYPWHLYGLTFRIFLPLLCGLKQECTLLHFSEELCAKTSPLLLITSPAFVSRLDFSLTPPEIRLTVSAGGRLNPEAAERYVHWSGCGFDEIYGSTETGVMATRYYKGQTLPWSPFPGISFAATKEGICLHSPLLPTPDFLLDDRLAFEEDGSFNILGRRDRTVKIEEQRISLTRLEAQYCKIEGICECAIVVLTSGEKTMLGAVLRVEESTLRQIEKQGLAGYKKALRQTMLRMYPGSVLPRKIRLVTTMPVNHMGKRPTAQLMELFQHADPSL